MDLADPGTCYEYFFPFVIFIMFQKNAFGPKNFNFHAWVQKCHFGNFSFFFFKLALLNPCMKIENIFGQKRSFEALQLEKYPAEI